MIVLMIPAFVVLWVFGPLWGILAVMAELWLLARWIDYSVESAQAERAKANSAMWERSRREADDLDAAIKRWEHTRIERDRVRD